MCDTEYDFFFFQTLNISQTFLHEDPITWETNSDFLAGKKVVRGLKVVNDTAERGIALIQSFNNSITADEEQKQFLLQVVEENRRDLPNLSKGALLEHLN